MNRKTKKLCQQNNFLDKQISKENEGIFSDMICYLRGSNISEYHIELVRQDLTEMVLSAQERGDDISQIIGDDYKGFCDNVIANLPPKTMKEKAGGILDTICWGLSILFAINVVISEDTLMIIQNVLSSKKVNLNISVSVGSVISIGLIMVLATVLTNVIMKGAFNKDTRAKKIVAFLAGVTFMAVLMGIMWLGEATLFTVNIFAACLFAAVLYGAHKALEAII